PAAAGDPGGGGGCGATRHRPCPAKPTLTLAPETRTYTRRVSRTIELGAGLMLLIIGLLVLSAGWIGDWLSRMGVEGGWLAYWPLLPVLLSLFLIGAALIRRRQHRRLRAGMAIPGALRLGPGLALPLSSLHDRWGNRPYHRTVVP